MAHFCVRKCVRVIFVCVLVMSGDSFGVGGFSWWIRKALLYDVLDGGNFCVVII